jgi:hypothetical protein
LRATEVKTKNKGKLEHVKVALNQKIRKGWRVTTLPRKSGQRNVLVAMPGSIDGLVLSSVKDNPTSRKF